MLMELIDSEKCMPTFGFVYSRLKPRERAMIRKCLNLGDIYLNGVETDDVRDSIINEMWLYLRDHLSDGTKKELSIAISRGNESSIINIIKYGFLNHCRDERRKNHPYYACKTSIREKLHRYSKQNSSMKYKSGRMAAFYAFCIDDPKDSSPGQWYKFNIHNFREWQAPPDDFKLANPAENAVAIAEFFWNESLRLLNGKYWIPIQELTNYIFAKFDLRYPSDTYRDDAEGDGEGDDIPDPRRLSEALENQYKTELTRIAGELVSSWDEKIKAVFHLTHNRNLTLKAIAEKGHKSVQYYLDIAKGSILAKWKDWMLDDVYDDNMYENIFDHFFSEIKRFVNDAFVAVLRE